MSSFWKARQRRLSAPARGGVPMFKYTDAFGLAAKHFRGSLTAAVEALIRSRPYVKYAPNNAYADPKLIVAWWAAALTRRLPTGMAVCAVSPGASNATNVARNAGPLVKYLMIPIANLIPGMNQAPEVAAGRYLKASEFGTDVSGQFFASAQGKFSGQMELQRQPHLRDRASREAAWQAVWGSRRSVLALPRSPARLNASNVIAARGGDNR